MTKYYIQSFKSYPIITKTSIPLCVDEVQIDDQYIDYHGSFENFEHGEYETCAIKPGTPLWAQWLPNGSVDIVQTEHSHTAIETSFTFGKDFDFDYSKPNLLPQPVNPQPSGTIPKPKPPQL